LRKADAYVAVLKTMCTWAIQKQGLPANKVFYLPNIVSQPSVPVTYSSSNKKKIIMVGNLWKFKNQLFAIELLKALAADYTLDIYGMVNDKEYYNSVVELISTYNLQARVKIIQGVNNICGL